MDTTTDTPTLVETGLLRRMRNRTSIDDSTVDDDVDVDDSRSDIVPFVRPGRPGNAGNPPPGDMDWDDDSPLPPRRPKVLTPVSWVMMAVLIGGGGFALGATVGKHKAPAAAAATSARTTATTRAGAGPTTTAAGGAAAATGAATAAGGGGTGRTGAGGTVGQVQLVDGNNIYIQDNQGNVVKVTPAPGAAITVNKAGTPADYKPGDTVIVQGTADANGNITAASSISASTGGFGRGGASGGGGGVGAGGATAARPATATTTGSTNG